MLINTIHAHDSGGLINTLDPRATPDRPSYIYAIVHLLSKTYIKLLIKQLLARVTLDLLKLSDHLYQLGVLPPQLLILANRQFKLLLRILHLVPLLIHFLLQFHVVAIQR